MRKNKLLKSSGKGHRDDRGRLNDGSLRHKSGKCGCHCGYDSTLPWWTPWIIVMATIVMRINYVMSPESWGLHHPDEIYQSVEVAFTEVYGYGFRPYEYLPPPAANTSIPTESKALQSDMYSLRSFLYPTVFTVVLEVAKLFDMDGNPFMICRVFNAMVTSTLPLSVYIFVNKLCACRLLAILSCALTASCLQLTVFGTHTLVNSFIGPQTFLALAFCLPQSSDDISDKERNPDVVTSCLNSRNENTITFTVSKVKNKPKCDTLRNGRNVNFNLPDVNGNIVLGHDSVQSSSEERVRDMSDITRDNNSCKLVDNKTSDMTSSRTTSILQRLFVYVTSVNAHALSGGCIVGITCYMRPDSLLFFAAILLPIYVISVKWKQKITMLLFICVGCCIAVVIGVSLDFSRYGIWTMSPVQWLKFNILSGKASVLFGSKYAGLCSYISILLVGKINFIINASAVIVILYALSKKTYMVFRSQFGALFLSFITMLIIYSCVGHKEPRFLHNLFVVHVILLSFALHTFIIYLRDYGCSRQIISVILISLCAVFIYNSYAMFPNTQNNSTPGWANGDTKTSRDVNICLDFIRQQNGVTGVMVNASIYNVGGFTVLKHNVPLLIKNHREFYLYHTLKKNRLGKRSTVRIINDFSDFVHQTNQAYMRRILTRDSTFNYAVTFAYLDKHLQQMKYAKLKTVGKFAIYNRNISLDEELKLNTAAKSIPLGENATILEYESNWLITNGLYHIAAERAKRALELDRSRVRLFQQMIVSYGKMQIWDKVQEYQEYCYRVHGRDTCNKQHKKVVVDAEYEKFDT